MHIPPEDVAIVFWVHLCLLKQVFLCYVALITSMAVANGITVHEVASLKQRILQRQWGYGWVLWFLAAHFGVNAHMLFGMGIGFLLQPDLFIFLSFYDKKQ